MSDMTAEFAARPGFAAGAAFDRLAPSYDDTFTDSLIGRAQRSVVWKALHNTFHAHDRLLELNCGTGEDAFFLASLDISVLSCDASRQMISQAHSRQERERPSPAIIFRHLSTERIAELDPTAPFDGAFSNFSGLNCVADLAPVAADLAALTRPHSSLLLCLSTRYCLLEILYYLLRGQPRKALRRCQGRAQASLDGAPLTVYYPTLRQLRRSFAPHFALRSIQGVGVAIPPSYLEPWARRHPRCFRLLCRIDALCASWPILRSTGDHVLLRFEKRKR